MTNESIQKILDRLNGEKHDDIIIAPIGKNAWRGYVWGETEQGYEMEGDIQDKSYEFYFVKAKDGKFAAAVFRMGFNEMHWFVSENYRKHGLLVRPLKKTILPFIFKLHRKYDQQEASIERSPHAKFSAKLARKVGFRCVLIKDGSRKFVIRRENVAKFVSRIRYGPTENELSALKRQIQITFRSLAMVGDRLRLQHPGDYDDERIVVLKEHMSDVFNDLTNNADTGV